MTEDARPTEEDPPLFVRYGEQFNESPPVFFWHSSPEQLERLMVEAMAAGKPLTREDLQRAQGDPTDPLPSGYDA